MNDGSSPTTDVLVPMPFGAAEVKVILFLEGRTVCGVAGTKLTRSMGFISLPLSCLTSIDSSSDCFSVDCVGSSVLLSRVSTSGWVGGGGTVNIAESANP